MKRCPPAVFTQMRQSWLLGHISASELIQTCAGAAPKNVVLTHYIDNPQFGEITLQFTAGGYTGNLYLPVTGDVIEP